MLELLSHGAALQLEVTVSSLKVKFWAVSPRQFQICSTVPLAVLPLGSSRHSPDCGLYSDPFDCGTNCCPPSPLQSHSSTLVPGAVPSPSRSRHRPSVSSESFELSVQCWSAADDWQSQMSTTVPSVPVSLPSTSTHFWPLSA